MFASIYTNRYYKRVYRDYVYYSFERYYCCCFLIGLWMFIGHFRILHTCPSSYFPIVLVQFSIDVLHILMCEYVYFDVLFDGSVWYLCAEQNQKLLLWIVVSFFPQDWIFDILPKITHIKRVDILCYSAIFHIVHSTTNETEVKKRFPFEKLKLVFSSWASIILAGVVL